MTLLEAARQALEALEWVIYPQCRQLEAITNLRTAISEAEKCEPVAIAATNIDVRTLGYVKALQDIHYKTPLYTHPAPAVPEEQFCFCGNEISLQMVSGGAAPEGLYGRVTLKVNGEYVDYVRAKPAVPEGRYLDEETYRVQLKEAWESGFRSGLKEKNV